MTPETREKKPIILPSIGILSESSDRPDYFDRVKILGIKCDEEGGKHFILGLEHIDGEIIKMKDRITPESHEDLKRYQTTLKKIKNKNYFTDLQTFFVKIFKARK